MLFCSRIPSRISMPKRRFMSWTVLYNSGAESINLCWYLGNKSLNTSSYLSMKAGVKSVLMMSLGSKTVKPPTSVQSFFSCRLARSNCVSIVSASWAEKTRCASGFDFPASPVRRRLRAATLLSTALVSRLCSMSVNIPFLKIAAVRNASGEPSEFKPSIHFSKKLVAWRWATWRAAARSGVSPAILASSCIIIPVLSSSLCAAVKSTSGKISFKTAFVSGLSKSAIMAS